MGSDADKQKSDKETYMRLFKGLLDEIADSSEEVLLVGGKKLLDDDAIVKRLSDKKTLSYVYLSGFLNLLGREINRENMHSVMKGIGVNPDPKTIDAIVNANNENGVMYVYSVYFLAILGKELNTKNIMDLVSSLGVEPNEEFAQNALEMYKRRYGKK